MSYFPISTSSEAQPIKLCLTAKGRLKSGYPKWMTHDELLGFLLNEGERTGTTADMTFGMIQSHPNIAYNKETDSYRFRPLHGIASADNLVEFLEKADPGTVLDVATIKDVWPTADEDINSLEHQRRVVVVRNKRDGAPKKVYSDDPMFHVELDDDFKSIWKETPLPEADAISEVLESLGARAATEKKALMPIATAQKKKKRRGPGNKKVTNVHMQGILKDYSAKRTGGKT